MKVFLITTILFINSTIWSQENDEMERLSDVDQISNVIDNFFYGLNNGDTSIILQISGDNVTLRTTFNDQEQNPRLIEEEYDEFLKSVGAPRKNKWEEQISEVDIKVDDNLANAWMNYSFYVNGEFSHCGVNVFHFFRTTEGWKIISIADTRRKEGCNQ